ncbi:MAG: ABC transporter substrate-binding protein, partial [Clostridia bacterium]|nr:ABC transporter substrate-binding protein [Clostridia bacterium]
MKTTLKRLFAVLLCLALIFALGACGNKTQDDKANDKPVALNVYCLSGPTGLGMADLINKSDNDQTKNDYTITVAAAPEDVTAQVINKTADIACIPTNLAANLYAKTNKDIQILAVNTMSVLYVLDTTGKVESFADLKGKTIYMPGQGSNPEYIVNHLLKKNGIDPAKDVTIEFKAEAQEVATLMASGKAEICIVPQPVATVIQTKADVKKVINLADEWSKIGEDSAIMMGCVVAQKAVINEHPEAVKTFLEEYEASVNAVKAD